MKIFLSICIFLSSLLCTAQPDKDSLLIADASQVRDTLEIMFYLQKHSGDYFFQTKEEQRLSNLNFDKFYEEEVKVKSPVTTIDIDRFLKKDNEGEVHNRKDFDSRVCSRINEVLVSIIKKYGFPSEKRLPAGIKPAGDTTVYFLSFNSEYDEEFKYLLKEEFKLDNIEEKDYNLARFLLKRKHEISKRDRKWLSKNTNANMGALND